MCPEERSPWRTIDPFSHPRKYRNAPHTPDLSQKGIGKGKNRCVLRNLLVSTGYTYYARSLQAAGLQLASRKPLCVKPLAYAFNADLDVWAARLREATGVPACGTFDGTRVAPPLLERINI